MKDKIKICHMVPSNYGGGVETAAKTFLSYSSGNFIFRVNFIKINKKENTFFSCFRSIKYLLKNKPDIILTSLWKSNFLALTYKLFNKDVKLILFLHSTKNIHLIDLLITNLTALFAYEIWADSNITMLERINNLNFFKFYINLFKRKKKKRVISLVTKKLLPLPKKLCKLTFIYWGRLCPNKNIDKAIKLFSKINQLDRNSSFIIIGPDNGVKEHLKSMIIKMKLEDQVFIKDFMNFKEIKKYANNACFFIQLSSFEGMSMSVSEAMQLGLIPIVTNVGQIKIYCKNLFNSLIYDKEENILIRNILEVVSSKALYSKIKKNATNTWLSSTTYRKDLIKIFDEISNNII